MRHMNPKVARPDPRRPHARPVLKAGERLYEGGCPGPALDGSNDSTTAQDWAELRGSVGAWGGADGSNYNLDCAED